jgi:hypothetical protein
MTDRKNYEQSRLRCESAATEVAARSELDGLLSYNAAMTGALASELEMTITDYNLLLARHNALMESHK